MKGELAGPFSIHNDLSPSKQGSFMIDIRMVRYFSGGNTPAPYIVQRLKEARHLLRKINSPDSGPSPSIKNPFWFMYWGKEQPMAERQAENMMMLSMSVNQRKTWNGKPHGTDKV